MSYTQDPSLSSHDEGDGREASLTPARPRLLPSPTEFAPAVTLRGPCV